jgi:hypothetical protein
MVGQDSEKLEKSLYVKFMANLANRHDNVIWSGTDNFNPINSNIDPINSWQCFPVMLYRDRTVAIMAMLGDCNRSIHWCLILANLI